MTTLVKTKNNGSLIPSVFSDLLDTDRFFSNWFEKEFASRVPAVNIKENGKEFSIELSAPGFSKNDFKVNVADDVLTISAEKQEETKEENERFTRKEFSYNSFTRSFVLPKSASGEKIDAKYENGVLKLALPKKEEAKTSPKKEIKVS